METVEKGCRICGLQSEMVFTARVLGRYDAGYFQCSSCGFLQTEEPYWLSESYAESIAASDTGGLLRGLVLSEFCSLLIYFFFDKDARYLDFGGGYGIFARRMRDIGFDFYLMDKYTPNLIARGFDYDGTLGRVEVVTSFESIEHFPDPMTEIDRMLSIGNNLVLTTELLPDPLPMPGHWHYYGLEHGQHVSFFRESTFRHIAKTFGLEYLNVSPFHLLTKRRLNRALLEIIFRMRRLGLFFYVKQRVASRTVQDSLRAAFMKDLSSKKRKSIKYKIHP